ncbi:hypothetical protein Trydic_g15543 [Trypoxylus dichotomus]
MRGSSIQRVYRNTSHISSRADPKYYLWYFRNDATHTQKPVCIHVLTPGTRDSGEACDTADYGCMARY